jgi:hypothetical protein
MQYKNLEFSRRQTTSGSRWIDRDPESSIGTVKAAFCRSAAKDIDPSVSGFLRTV